MKKLTVVYDATKPLCLRTRAWLTKQPKLVPIEFVRAGTAGAVPLAGPEELAVIGDRGAVYRGAHAWLMCLWALEEFRERAVELEPLQARRVIEKLAEVRPPVSASIGFTAAILGLVLGLIGGSLVALFACDGATLMEQVGAFGAVALWIWLTCLIGMPFVWWIGRQVSNALLRVVLQIVVMVLAIGLAGIVTLVVSGIFMLALR